MSRSNPIDINPNPATRFFEWNGSTGNLKYYDKETEQNVAIELPFEFVLLDRLSIIKGFHNNSNSGIISNEVRDTRSETLFVKAFGLAEPIAEGFYKDIKDKVKAAGGSYAINLYIAYTNDEGELVLGGFVLRGAARSAWMDFESDKENRALLYKNGIVIKNTSHGEKKMGKTKIEWEAPVFELVEVPAEINDKASDIDRNILQPYLRNYFKRGRPEQAEPEDRTDYSPEYDQRQPEEEPF